MTRVAAQVGEKEMVNMNPKVLPRMGKTHKYGAKQTVVDGHTFPSKREAARYSELRLLEKAGEIDDLELQPSFDLHVAAYVANCPPGVRSARKVARYVADFRYVVRLTGAVVYEDSKGFSTPVYKLKRKMVQAEYGIDIVEV
jgi:hypothetical protein